MSPPYLVKLRCSKLLHNVEMYYLQQTLMTELAHSKLKYGLVSRVISCHDKSAQNCQNSCSKCVPRTWTQALIRLCISRLSLAPGKRHCCVLDALGCHPVETQENRPGTTCACPAVASKQESCRNSMPSSL